jgi:hypothetical protein
MVPRSQLISCMSGCRDTPLHIGSQTSRRCLLKPTRCHRRSLLSQWTDGGRQWNGATYEAGNSWHQAADVAERLQEEDPKSAAAGQIYASLAIAEAITDLAKQVTGWLEVSPND